MNLYLKNGFLDQESIYNAARAAGCSFVIEIGARQVGKTYGTLKFMLDNKQRFILMRRTQTEADFMTAGAVNPFLPIDPEIVIKKETAYTGSILKGDEKIGLTMALSTVSKIRGFYGGTFTHLVYDEFIPERHVIKMRYEGDAFLNALITIGGNRELRGEPALFTWLLANSNNLASPILAALNVQEKIEKMVTKGQEFSILPDRGIMLVIPSGGVVRDKRKSDSLNRAIGGESAFTSMAYDNKFSYNDPENVRPQALKEYTPLASIENLISVYRHKGNGSIYITTPRNTGTMFAGSERGKGEFLKKYSLLRSYYLHGRIFYESIAVKEAFKALYNFD